MWDKMTYRIHGGLCTDSVYPLFSSCNQDTSPLLFYPHVSIGPLVHFTEELVTRKLSDSGELPFESMDVGPEGRSHQKEFVGSSRRRNRKSQSPTGHWCFMYEELGMTKLVMVID